MYAYNEQPAGLRIPDRYGLTEGQEAELRELAWSWILVGSTDAEDFAEYHLDDQPDDYPLDAARTEEVFAHLLAARRAQQGGWSAEETTPPLARAFEALADIGVLARGSFTCCGTCGHAEIGDERDDSRVWRGFVYYHSQDTEQLIESRSTYVGYGVFLEAYLGEPEWEALPDDQKDRYYETTVLGLMNDEVIPILRQHGVTVRWDGALSTRILLDDVDHYTPV
ncbi:MAG: DUF6891 domain-containing protein [Nocardioides sp.]